ncbi:MAG: Fe-S cluster assembly ATPase SufC [Candidatus Pacebacteria bacterium]|nr:Fe-S cluster assembly ATPase SufC [Candidatus Paceibacterota bacterium]
MKKLVVKNLHVKVADKIILNGLNLELKKGEVHAIMGPNGAGKSTLAKVLMGDSNYEVIKKTGQKVEMDGKDLLSLDPNERAELGLFLSFQNPVEIPGVRVETFLREAYKARFKDNDNKIEKALEFRKYLISLAEKLSINPDLLKRGLNENFSGGEKKRLEILQMAVLKPEFAILDETDSGLDIDALKTVAAGVKMIIEENNTGVLVITHYQRILEYLNPDKVHVMVDGKVVESGDQRIVNKLEKEGYRKWVS